jgi:hypothetical protein
MNTVNRSKCSAHQPELHRQHHEEGQHQAAVVAAPRGRQRDELAQREEGHQREQHRGAFARRPASQNTTTMTHEVAQQLAEVAQPGMPASPCGLPALAQRQQEPRHAGQRQHAEHDEEQRPDLLGA